MKEGLIVKTKNGKKGYIYNNDTIYDSKAKVHIVDEQYKETGEKLLCDTKNLIVIGYKD
ncbi:hypothetical protein ACFSTE_15885 [Aquimarina hainanensis]|uniref:Uncharacterized protein n=1 Tax=Aquimarina hainanensis TaxID=1578017 RepID=A0ABW5NBR8_9FLAO